MRMIKTFSVTPRLPDNLKRLEELAYNLWWSWNLDGVELFRRLDNELWEQVNHNPVALLGRLPQEQLVSASEDAGFCSHMNEVLEDFDLYMSEPKWFQKKYGEGVKTSDGRSVVMAYFCAEYGLTECLPIYSGGLGILAGDHLKSASDLGLPLIGVGLLYSQGYFRQYLNADGWQQEAYPDYDYSKSPARLVKKDDGTALTIEVDYPGKKVFAQVWQVDVGRVKLYLLDANIPENDPEDREITARLYGGDLEMRIKQEILLGIGGIRLLRMLGVHIATCHMNEGHSAFMGLERIRLLMEEDGLSFNEAKEALVSSNVFTTHTPVPAGNDVFPINLMEKYFGDYYPKLGLSKREFLNLGRQREDDDNEPFCMTVLALKLAGFSNGVSQLHGAVSRGMWKRVWPYVPEDEIPITHITNGVHISSWMSKDMAGLLDRYLGPGWKEDPTDKGLWERVYKIPDAELWRTHERRRERLVAFARRRLKYQLARRGAVKSEIERAEEVLDPEALTIGFARRFATYKRGTLLFRNIERLSKILNDSKRPVQIIFAGKAHPRDVEGKDLIRQIIHISRREDFRRKIVFLEDYDISVARYMLQGVDVWLNTPRKPMEASGTSGMKAACNGVLNVSVLDGWWVEGFNGEIGNGWAIGAGEIYDDPNYQDEVESNALYDILEKEVVPLFYERGKDGVPRKWVQRMKNSMASITPQFNTHRMVRDYVERAYIPAAVSLVDLIADRYKKAIEKAELQVRLKSNWHNIQFESIEQLSPDSISIGEPFKIRVVVDLDGISPESVDVQLYLGQIDRTGKIRANKVVSLNKVNSDGSVHYYEGEVVCESSGIHGYGIRILPKDIDGRIKYEPGLILWA